MQRKLLAVCAVCAGGSVAVGILFGQGANSAGDRAAVFQKAVLPVLAKNCFTCHNQKLHTANLNLEIFGDAAAAAQKPEVWEKVRDKLTAGQMPPPPMPPLSAAELAAVSAWIDSVIGRSPAANPDPGRVTARRLNRVEYNNTIRDLLSVTVRPADEFPVDDSGYGFDNIGDVLSLSPLLMEKYMKAAQSVSRIAVYGEPYQPKPSLIAKLMPKKFQDDTPATGNVLPFSMRGALYGSFHFPVTADYEFQIRLANFRGPEFLAKPGSPAGLRGAGRRGPLMNQERTDQDQKAFDERNRQGAPPVRMVLTIDGKTVHTDLVEGTTNYQYSRGASLVRLHLTAGDHYLRASFPELANLRDPRENLNPDGRRKLFVDYMNIVGPYQPEAAPPESYRKIFVCGHPPGKHVAQCAPAIVAELARRAYRRPPAKVETAALLKLVSQVQKQGDSFEEGIRTAVQAVLLSPNFLFRIERDSAPGDAVYAVSDHELASRLSYFLWNSMPDDELLRAAAEHRLRQPAVLEAQVRRMLESPKSAALVDNFAAQWLNLRLLDRKKPDPARFPTVDDELLDAMRRETALFVSAIIRQDRSVLDLIDARFTFANGPLARYYGLAGVDGEEFRRVELDGGQRSGVVTHGSVLTLSSYANRTSPVIRGKWVLETLLGTAPPPPPPDVPALQEANLGTAASLRQRLEQHRANASCAVCHNQMDPIGFGLENYDAAGGWRTKDGDFPVDSSGTLPDGRSFSGARGLKEILRTQSSLFVQNLTGKMLTYALGRGLERSDRTVVDRISTEASVNGYRFSALVMEIVKSAPFQMRKGAGGPNESK